MPDLRITVVQTALAWENAAANREHFGKLLAPLLGTTDLVILPEMFTTGFTLNGEHLAEEMDGPTVRWLQRLAQSIDAAVTGSIIIREGTSFYNRLVWMAPSGEMFHYDKRHLFRYAREDTVYTAGKNKLIIDYKGWKIRPFICYDLRFPAWSANVGKEYDLGIYVANWPAARAGHWQALLMARAIENQAYIAGVNRIGRDGNGLEYAGSSALFGPQGESIHECGAQQELVTCTISQSELEGYRSRFPAWMDISRD